MKRYSYTSTGLSALHLLRLNEKNEKTGNLTLTFEKFTKEDKSNFSRFAKNMNSFVSEGQSHLVIILNST